MRARTVVIGTAVVLAGLAAAAAAAGFGGAKPDEADPQPLPPSTAAVTRQTMVDTDEVPGNLGYGVVNSLAGRISGVITKMPLPGDVIGRNQPVYTVDNTPVVLMYGEVVAYRALAIGVSGPDVRQLESNLDTLGFHGFTVDDSFSASTATAVKQWQKSLGLAQTGEVEQGRVLFAPGQIAVSAVSTGLNQSTGGGEEVLRYTGTGRQITARLEVAKQRLARKGATVQIRLPDGKTAPGHIERVYTVIEQPGDPGSQPETWLEAVVALEDPAAAQGIEAAVVTLMLTAGQRENVLTVPIAALVALAEGGYGVEIVEGTTTRYLKVQTGLFAGGRVEVTGDGLSEGMTVGMPR